VPTWVDRVWAAQSHDRVVRVVISKVATTLAQANTLLYQCSQCWPQVRNESNGQMRILQPEYRERAIAAEIESTNAMGKIPVVLALLQNRHVVTTPAPEREA
jgi:hypothetical protein